MTARPAAPRPRRLAAVAAAVLAAAALPPLTAGPAAAVTVPSGFRVSTVAGALQNATSMALLPDGGILVARQSGQLRLIRGGRSAVVLTLSVDSSGERGLIGVAVDPAYASNGYIYTHHTMPTTPRQNRVTRFTLPPGSSTAGSPRTLLTLPGLSATNHNGGALHFDRAGKLLVAVGENAVPSRAQDLSNPFGKVLRVEPSTGAPATGNPFLSSTNGWTKRIWAYGLRNPFTMAVQPGSGRLHINDVGEQDWEEVNLGRGGGNYGWPGAEGPSGTGGIRPIVYYPHTGPETNSGCSIAGGAFYNPTRTTWPADFAGDYFYADFCGGWVRRYDVASGSTALFGTGFGNVVDLRVGATGSLFVLSRSTLYAVSRQAPALLWQLRNSNSAGQASVRFPYGAPSDRPLACDWDGDGYATPAVRRGSTWLIRDSNSAGPATRRFDYGAASDVPVCGDWNGDGVDTVGVRRGNVFFLRNSNTGGVGEIAAAYGEASDVPVVGDWNGDGRDSLGARRGSTWLVTDRLGGSATRAFVFGAASDRPVVGQWDRDRADEPGVVRAGEWILGRGLESAVHTRFRYGASSDRPVAGDWDRDGFDTPGAVRG